MVSKLEDRENRLYKLYVLIVFGFCLAGTSVMDLGAIF